MSGRGRTHRIAEGLQHRSPFAQALVAFSPGGLEAMSLLSIALGLDPLFVSAHHLARFILISVTLPFVLRRYVLPRSAVRISSL